MKVTFGKSSGPVYCDTGPHADSMRVDLLASVYLTADEHARYGGTESLQVTLKENPAHEETRPAVSQAKGR